MCVCMCAIAKTAQVAWRRRNVYIHLYTIYIDFIGHISILNYAKGQPHQARYTRWSTQYPSDWDF